jgi:hypothetical protein
MPVYHRYSRTRPAPVPRRRHPSSVSVVRHPSPFALARTRRRPPFPVASSVIQESVTESVTESESESESEWPPRELASYAVLSIIETRLPPVFRPSSPVVLFPVARPPSPSPFPVARPPSPVPRSPVAVPRHPTSDPRSPSPVSVARHTFSGFSGRYPCQFAGEFKGILTVRTRFSVAHREHPPEFLHTAVPEEDPVSEIVSVKSGGADFHRRPAVSVPRRAVS